MAPLISCLCITRGRVSMLRHAVSLFQAQTYPNKELLIIYESDDQGTADYVSQISNQGIRSIVIPAEWGMQLGALRNLAVEKSEGVYFCQWDDDDWHHPQRLEHQYRAVIESGMPASILLHWIIYDAIEAKAYISGRRPWEGSLLCKKAILGNEIRYKNMPVGEDTIVVKKLFAKHLIFPVIMPKLYIYVYHGDNAWAREHWHKLFQASIPFSEESNLVISDIVEGKHNPIEAAELLASIKQ